MYTPPYVPPPPYITPQVRPLASWQMLSPRHLGRLMSLRPSSRLQVPHNLAVDGHGWSLTRYVGVIRKEFQILESLVYNCVCVCIQNHPTPPPPPFQDGNLSITKTPNAECPLAVGDTAILTMDVWEHAYYVDFRNRRPDFMTNYLDNLVDWSAVAARYEAATA